MPEPTEPNVEPIILESMGVVSLLFLEAVLAEAHPSPKERAERYSELLLQAAAAATYMAEVAVYDVEDALAEMGA